MLYACLCLFSNSIHGCVLTSVWVLSIHGACVCTTHTRTDICNTYVFMFALSCASVSWTQPTCAYTASYVSYILTSYR